MSLHKIHTRMVIGPDGQVEEDEFYWHDTEVDGPIAMAQGEGWEENYRLDQEAKRQGQERDRRKAAGQYVRSTQDGDEWVVSATDWTPAADPGASTTTNTNTNTNTNSSNNTGSNVNTSTRATSGPQASPAGSQHLHSGSGKTHTAGTLRGPLYVDPASQTIDDYGNYVDQYTGLSNTWIMINAFNTGGDLSGFRNAHGMTPAQQAEYWNTRMGGQNTKEAFGQAHYGESSALHAGTYQGQTQMPWGTGVRRYQSAVSSGGGEGGGAGAGAGAGEVSPESVIQTIQILI